MSSALQAITEQNFDEYLQSINRCIKDLSTIRFVIDTFKSFSRDSALPGTATLKNIQDQLENNSKSIVLEKSYILFCELIGAEYYINEIASDSVPLFPLIQSISPEHVPIFPWQVIANNDFLIYKDQAENKYYEDLVGTKNEIVTEVEKNKLCRFEFDKKFLSTIAEMNKYPRSREVLSLYQTYLLSKQLFKKDFISPIRDLERKLDSGEKKEEPLNLMKLEVLNLRLSSQVKNYEIEDKSIEDLNYEEKKNNDKKLDYMPEFLFMKHYSAAQKSLETKGTLRIDQNLSNIKWKELQQRLKCFGDQLLTIKVTDLPVLLELDNIIKTSNNSERENNKLFRDVKRFFDSNDISIEEKFPTARNISNKKPGGPGLLKRITAYGGLSSFENDYTSFLNNNKNPEKAQIDSVPKLSTDGDSTPKGTLTKLDFYPDDNNSI